MRNMTIDLKQQVVNRINAGQEFTCPEFTLAYVVGIKELHKSKNPSLYWDNIYDDIYPIVDKIQSEYPEPHTTIGQWYNKETGEYVVDEGITLSNLEDAIALGKKHNQICIWDAVKDEIIKL